MKSAPASSGSYYFQGYQGTFVIGCLDSDKQFKHLWFFVSSRWLHSHLPYGEVLSSERVPVTFRRGYVWTRGLHVEAKSLERIDILREKADPEQNHNRLLSPVGLTKYNWFSSSSTSNYPHDRLRTVQPREVTIARMLDPVHYRARTVATVEVATMSDWSEVLRGVPIASSHGQRSSSSFPRAWGPRIVDGIMNLMLGQLLPMWGLRIEGHYVILIFLQ